MSCFVGCAQRARGEVDVPRQHVVGAGAVVDAGVRQAADDGVAVARAAPAAACARRSAMPGTEVAIGRNSPRMPAGASGFRSHVSCAPARPRGRAGCTPSPSRTNPGPRGSPRSARAASSAGSESPAVPGRRRAGTPAGDSRRTAGCRNVPVGSWLFAIESTGDRRKFRPASGRPQARSALERPGPASRTVYTGSKRDCRREAFSMTQTIEAIYENGVLRPVQPLEGVEDHARVRLVLEIEPPGSGNEPPPGRRTLAAALRLNRPCQFRKLAMPTSQPHPPLRNERHRDARFFRTTRIA